jgi:hypothetical protein
MRRYEQAYDEEEIEEEEEPFSPFNELCRFADEYHLNVEIDKPFPEMNKMFLKIKDSEGEEVSKVVLDDIVDLNSKSASILNDLSKAKNWD